MYTEEPKSKKQINEECIINRLPGHLIERVFFRLPVSTLLMCGGVCKQWQNFIRDPQFVASHLLCAPSYDLLFFPQDLVSGELYPSDAILIDEAWSPSTYAVPVIGPDDLLFGSCNGLLGLYTKTSTIKISNLATGECLHLEKPAKNVESDDFYFYSFGFHPMTKEYKITHFLSDCINGLPHNKSRFNIIQFYTLGDEKWKDIRTPEALSLISVRNSGIVHVDGKMYWLTEDMLASWQHAVMSFDLSEESFAMIQLPAAYEDHDYYGPRKFWIRDIDGKICIVTGQTSRYDARTLVGELQIWALDNMVEQRWSQKYNIKHPPDYILGPRFVHRDRILTQHGSNNVCSYELLGENFEIDSSKMVKLLDFSARRHNSLQSHNCVKSLVRLDVYKSAEIVRRPKQREGWELKKWEAWKHELSEKEKLWCDIHRDELNGIACAQRNVTRFSALLHHILDDAIRREIGMKTNQIFPNFPDQPRPLRRLNCVAQKLDLDNLIARVNNYKTIMKAMMQTTDSIFGMIDSSVDDQIGASSSNAGISSQNHSEGDDAKT